MEDLIRILDGDPDDPQPEDFASIDKEMGQMHEVDGKLWVITFVTNDDPIGFYADEGSFPISGGSTLSAARCPCRAMISRRRTATTTATAAMASLPSCSSPAATQPGNARTEAVDRGPAHVQGPPG